MLPGKRKQIDPELPVDTALPLTMNVGRNMRFEVLTPVNMKTAVFLNAAE
jgi:hypothetical protein